MTTQTLYLKNGKLKPRKPLEQALLAGADPNEGLVAVHEAVSSGRKDALDLLLQYGADLEVEDSDGDTAMTRACMSNALTNQARVEMIERLVHHGSEVNHSNHARDTPLLACIKADRVTALECLLVHGADITVIGRNGLGVFALADEYSDDCLDALRAWVAKTSKENLQENIGTNKQTVKAPRQL